MMLVLIVEWLVFVLYSLLRNIVLLARSNLEPPRIKNYHHFVKQNVILKKTAYNDDV